MKRVFLRIMAAVPIWLLFGSSAAAMCIWFVPPSRQFAPATNMKTFISREEGEVRMVAQPEFSGNATDFALVMPFPSQPTVAEAPEEIFNELEDLTNPVITQRDDVVILEAADATAVRARDSGVRVIEERDVGDYSTVTLEATSADGLSSWLEENGYEMTGQKRDIVSQYVGENAYFVALKVNMEAAKVDSLGILKGQLKPIEFSFAADNAVLPLRLMAGDNSLVTMTVYTLADTMTYIPGGEIQYSRKVTSSDQKDFATLEKFDAWRKWLVRNVIQVETAEIESDLVLLETRDTVIVVPEEEPIILNPDQLPPGTGILVSENGEVRYSEEPTNNVPTITEESDAVTWTMVVALTISNVILLILFIRQAEANKKKKR